MYKLILITLFTTLLSAHNPKPYAALGDVIYNNIKNIESLKEIDAYKLYIDDIDKYTSEVYKAKEEGYALEKKSSSSAKKGYLNKLRSLSKTNDYFLRSLKNQYKESMKKDNYKLFSQIINSGLLNTQKNKKEIIDYYYKNKENLTSQGIIDSLLEEDARLRAKKEGQKKRYKTKQQLEAEKIKRIRENDKAQQKKLEADLQKDLNTKKAKIREIQKIELAH
ncbi:hypothetical protein JHD49_00440 [Sulfurimonas sp. SAG-AH-194-C21]|nr:hypothetical protein [Sulfurimonas sp. SAG-AH-194-C21]MDF1882403.1 hypothetical protein [Sulfurimonas sp. SAG-AH-194-C21]